MSSATSLLSLNHDVLCAIVSFLSTKDAINLSCTAHGIHTIAKHHALTVVTIQSAVTFLIYCRYVLDDIPDRLHRLRELCITESTFDYYGSWSSLKEYTSMLADVLEQAYDLRMLSLWSLATLADPICTPRICAALSRLPSLTKANLHWISPSSLQVIRSLPTGLRKLTLGKISPIISFEEALMSLAPLQSLETVKFLDMQCNPSLSGKHEQLIQLGGVKSLSVTAEGIISIPPFMWTFPNIRHLEMCSECYRIRPDDRPHASVIDGRTSLWSSLESIRGSRVFFEDCHINYSVHQLHWDRDPICDLDTCRLALRAICSMSPVVLSMSVWRKPTMDAFWTEVARGLRRLKTLDLAIDDGFYKFDSSWVEYATLLSTALATCEVMCVRLWIGDPPSSATSTSEDSSLPAPISETSDLLVFPELLMRNVPSLRLISLCARDQSSGCVYSEHDQEISWWRVTGSNSSRALEEVPREIGERAMSYMQSEGCDFDAVPGLQA